MTCANGWQGVWEGVQRHRRRERGETTGTGLGTDSQRFSVGQAQSLKNALFARAWPGRCCQSRPVAEPTGIADRPDGSDARVQLCASGLHERGGESSLTSEGLTFVLSSRNTSMWPITRFVRSYLSFLMSYHDPPAKCMTVSSPTRIHTYAQLVSPLPQSDPV